MNRIMKPRLLIVFMLVTTLLTTGDVFAASEERRNAQSAVAFLGRDYVFPNKLKGLPEKLSDFTDLKIGTFQTSDDVTLTYWEAGSGEPLVFVPGWAAHGAGYINVLYLLSQRYHVYVLDQRNQGLSQEVEYGNSISRFAMDLREFANHVGLEKANYCGWSMGAAVLWCLIDMFGVDGINKFVIIDEPPSIYAHSDWSEKERREAGAFVTSVEGAIAAFAAMGAGDIKPEPDSLFDRFMATDSPYYVNSESFSREFVKNRQEALGRVLFDHMMNDWRDVIRTKITIPTAIFTGEYSANAESQRWMHTVIPGSKLYVYTKGEQGDHFLAFKNPFKFIADVVVFLENN